MKENLNQEFHEFLNSNERPPADLSTRLTSQILNQLNPSPFHLFFKLAAIHSFLGGLSLAVCHQFGINPFGTSWSLADLFMNVGGHGFCMLACGLFFIGGSYWLAGWFLTADEIRVLRQREFLQVALVSALSLAVLAFFGAEMALAFTGLWLLGALVGGCLATEFHFYRYHLKKA